MKKSVILIIAVVYVASVFIVGLLGIKMGLYNRTVYVEEIVYKPVGALDKAKSNDDVDIYRKDPLTGAGYSAERLFKTAEKKKAEGCDVRIEELYKEGISFELKFDVFPTNASKTNLEYSYDKSAEEKGIINFEIRDGNAFITFNRGGKLKVYVKPADGANLTYTVEINVILL